MTDDAVEAFTNAVVPRLYLSIPSGGIAIASEVVEAAGQASDAVIRSMIASDEWRVQKVGAWLAIAKGEPLTEDVFTGLRASKGTLTSPSFIVAALVLGGERAVPALNDYGNSDDENSWLGVGVVSAALDHLGQPNPFPAPSEFDAASFDRHLAIAQAIRDAVSQV